MARTKSTAEPTTVTAAQSFYVGHEDGSETFVAAGTILEATDELVAGREALFTGTAPAGPVAIPAPVVTVPDPSPVTDPRAEDEAPAEQPADETPADTEQQA